MGTDYPRRGDQAGMNGRAAVSGADLKRSLWREPLQLRPAKPLGRRTTSGSIAASARMVSPILVVTDRKSG